MGRRRQLLLQPSAGQATSLPNPIRAESYEVGRNVYRPFLPAATSAECVQARCSSESSTRRAISAAPVERSQIRTVPSAPAEASDEPSCATASTWTVSLWPASACRSGLPPAARTAPSGSGTPGLECGWRGCRRCNMASWWRRIKISAVCHAASRRDSRSHAVTRVMRKEGELQAHDRRSSRAGRRASNSPGQSRGCDSRHAQVAGAGFPGRWRGCRSGLTCTHSAPALKVGGRHDRERV